VAISAPGLKIPPDTLQNTFSEAISLLLEQTALYWHLEHPQQSR